MRCAAEFIRRGGKDDWSVIEAELLNGQKMQGQLTCKDVYDVIDHHKVHHMFPLFTTIYRISFENALPSLLIDSFAVEEPRLLKSLQSCSPCALTGNFA